MSDRIGQQIGNYRLKKLLGQGGFADVYLGEQIYLQTQAAIKLLRITLGQNDLDAFLREARIIANLTHPHIVRVLEFGEQDNTAFLVMDYAPLGAISNLHSHGSQLSVTQVVTYVQQAAAALQYAHDQKIIHRDIKPENMLVGRNGEILLSDFGIAVILQSSRHHENINLEGTIAYMAPEQLQGKVSAASDQYALALVAYEWLTGTRPFKGTLAEIGSQHLFALPPSLREKVPSLPSAIDHVLLTALAKDPQQRHASIQAFADLLEQAGYAAGADTGKSVFLSKQPAAPDWQSPPAPLTLSSQGPSQTTQFFQAQHTTVPESTLPSLPEQTSGWLTQTIPPQQNLPSFPTDRPAKLARRNNAYMIVIGILAILLVGSSLGGIFLWKRSGTTTGNRTIATHGIATTTRNATAPATATIDPTTQSTATDTAGTVVISLQPSPTPIPTPSLPPTPTPIIQLICSGTLSSGWTSSNDGPPECNSHAWNAITPTSAYADYSIGTITVPRTYSLFAYVTPSASAYMNYDPHVGNSVKEACPFNSHVSPGWHNVCSFSVSASDVGKTLSIHEWSGQVHSGLVLVHSAIELEVVNV